MSTRRTPDPHVRPPENLSWHCWVSMFEKRVSQSERRIRNSQVTSMRTGTPLNSNCQVYILALESARTKHMTIVLNYVKYVIVLIQHCQEILQMLPLSGGHTWGSTSFPGRFLRGREKHNGLGTTVRACVGYSVKSQYNIPFHVLPSIRCTYPSNIQFPMKD